jgi:Fe-S-cluster containining protein
MFDMNYHGTAQDLPEEHVHKHLPDLCHKCGRCCRSATTYAPHQKLLAMAEEGHKEAQDFLNIFEPYESVEAARAVVPEQVNEVMRIAAARDDMNADEVTFYHCRFVTDEGLCGIYDKRPRCCREAPVHGWSAMPPGCGFEGWQFAEREKQKRMIRDLKGSAYLIEQLSPDGVMHPTRPDTTLDAMTGMVEEKIKPWKQFGAEFW